MPFFQIALKNSELKAADNTFRDCRLPFFSDNLSRKSCIPVCQNEHQQNHILAVQDLKSRFHCLWFKEKHWSQGRARDEAKTAETWGLHNSFGQLLLDCRSPVEQLKLNNREFEILSEAKIAVKDANTNEEISKFPIYVNDPL